MARPSPPRLHDPVRVKAVTAPRHSLRDFRAQRGKGRLSPRGTLSPPTGSVGALPALTHTTTQTLSPPLHEHRNCNRGDYIIQFISAYCIGAGSFSFRPSAVPDCMKSAFL